MSRLFIEVYLDEDVDNLVAALLRARGFTATTTVEAGNRGASDADQLAYAAARGQALLTHNRGDFEALARAYALAGHQHAGIILATRRPPHEVARRLLRLLNQVTADEMRDQVRYL